MPHAGGTLEGVTLGLDAAAALLKKQETCAADMQEILCQGKPCHEIGETQDARFVSTEPAGVSGGCLGGCASIGCFWVIKHW